MPKLNTELEEILRVFLTETAQGASKATREMWVKHANTQLTALIDRKVAEALNRVLEKRMEYISTEDDSSEEYSAFAVPVEFIEAELKTLTQQEEKK